MVDKKYAAHLAAEQLVIAWFGRSALTVCKHCLATAKKSDEEGDFMAKPN